MPMFSYSRIRNVFITIVHNRRALCVIGGVNCFKIERAVPQASNIKTEVSINRAAVDYMIKRSGVDVLEFATQSHLDFGLFKHISYNVGISVPGDSLISVRKIPVIVVEPHGQAL